MKEIVFLDYTFLFDPGDTWSSVSNFESDLAKFLTMKGLKGDFVRTVGGQIGKKVLIITRKKDILDPKSHQNTGRIKIGGN